MLGEAALPPGLDADLFPVLVLLRDLALRLAGIILDGLTNDKCAEVLALAVWKHIKNDLGTAGSDFERGLWQALDDGRCLLALDGLDEVPRDLRPRIRQSLRAGGLAFLCLSIDLGWFTFW